MRQGPYISNYMKYVHFKLSLIVNWRQIPMDSDGFRRNSGIPVNSCGIRRNSRIPADSGRICGGIKSIGHLAAFDMGVLGPVFWVLHLMHWWVLTPVGCQRSKGWGWGAYLGFFLSLLHGRPCPGLPHLWPGCLMWHWEVLGGGVSIWGGWSGLGWCTCVLLGLFIMVICIGDPPTLPLFSSWLLGPIDAFTAFVKPGDVAVMVVKSKQVGSLTLSNDGLHHLWMGGWWADVGRGLSSSTVAAAGGHQRDCWGSSTSVTWQPAPVQFGVQKTRGRAMGRGTHLGCVQWVLVVVIGSAGSGWGFPSHVWGWNDGDVAP